MLCATACPLCLPPELRSSLKRRLYLTHCLRCLLGPPVLPQGAAVQVWYSDFSKNRAFAGAGATVRDPDTSAEFQFCTFWENKVDGGCCSTGAAALSCAVLLAGCRAGWAWLATSEHPSLVAPTANSPTDTTPLPICRQRRRGVCLRGRPVPHQLLLHRQRGHVRRGAGVGQLSSPLLRCGGWGWQAGGRWAAAWAAGRACALVKACWSKNAQL
jgi:hypothetical protein